MLELTAGPSNVKSPDMSGALQGFKVSKNNWQPMKPQHPSMVTIMKNCLSLMPLNTIISQIHARSILTSQNGW
jgi:hypothetical protein